MNQIAQAWILKGYEHFAEVGPIKFSVKRVSEENQFSRTTFNYHFKNQNEFFEQLFSLHIDYSKSIIDHVKKCTNQYSPDVFELLYQYPFQLKFQLQLFNHRFLPELNSVLTSSNNIYSDEFMIKSFRKQYNLNASFKEIQEVHSIFIDTWYSRLNTQGTELAAMIDTADNIIVSIFPFFIEEQSALAKISKRSKRFIESVTYNQVDNKK